MDLRFTKQSLVCRQQGAASGTTLHGLIVAYPRTPRRLIKFGHHNYSTIQQRDATCRYLLLSTIHYHAPPLYDVRRSQLDYNPTNHVATCWYNATPLPRTPAFITTLYNVVLNCKSIMIHPSIIWCFMGRCRLDKYSAIGCGR